MSETTLTVRGMTCEHCTRAVREELLALPGVESVLVELESGAVVVRGDHLVDSELRAAIDAAGYEAT